MLQLAIQRRYKHQNGINEGLIETLFSGRLRGLGGHGEHGHVGEKIKPRGRKGLLLVRDRFQSLRHPFVTNGSPFGGSLRGEQFASILRLDLAYLPQSFEPSSIHVLHAIEQPTVKVRRFRLSGHDARL